MGIARPGPYPAGGRVGARPPISGRGRTAGPGLQAESLTTREGGCSGSARILTHGEAPAESRRLEFLHLAKVCRNRGAGAFACQPRTRPRPIGWIRYQTGANRIVLHIVNDAGQFHFIPHTMVKRFILPESLSR